MCMPIVLKRQTWVLSLDEVSYHLTVQRLCPDFINSLLLNPFFAI
jgi:hypothetical protein